jgi:SPP1 gp7 family putative phage head morphogenesis protein
MIFQPDPAALQNLIGRMSDGSPLARFLEQLEPDVKEAAKAALIESFRSGESSSSIAKRLNDITGIGRSRAMIIARTETNAAHKAASIDRFREAGIDGYIWMSTLDPRTCAICWSLHGQRFNSDADVRSHVGCRCTTVPVVENLTPIKTGAERFAELEPGYQKQILGSERFERYRSGTKLSDLVKAQDESEVDYFEEYDLDYIDYGEEGEYE